MITIDYDNLTKLLFELDPKRQKMAVRGAFRKAATTVRKQAVSNLRSSGIRSNRDLEKGIRRIVYKKTAGFRVTVGTKRANKNGKGESGFHTNRRGLKKPVLVWAEDGTRDRSTKTRRFIRKKKGHFTGKMPKYGFMEKTKNEMKDRVTDELRMAMVESITKTAKKYGCK